MIKGVVEFLLSGLSSLKPTNEFVHRDIYGRVVEHADEFFHPVKFRGIPVFDSESILVHYKPQLDRLREVVDIGDHRKTPDGKPMFDELYTNIIKRYISFAHMIPASEDHHHSHTGGLLTHSIEASIEALRWSKELKCQVTHMPDLDAKIKPIMDYAAWLGTLLHDVGKIMRDISVDAVEVIHPLTKRPIPIFNPIVSWHPQKQSLTDWAKINHISAYSVTWLRHRTHNRHNIDSGQLLQPLLNGTFALDYLLSSPIKQELYSELVRCLSGYTHQKGHISDCMRMGDSVSTNKSLSIQYDRIRGNRNISTATKIYQCINHARKSWDWNRPKSEGWVIGNSVYMRWSSAIDTIVTASNELQYGLPTDTRNIITIMEQNGFTHLFDAECTNDRIVKFTPGNFTEKQIDAIVSGQQPVTWLDLIKIITPQIVFGENPMPPSMTGIFYLPNAKLFYSVTKDGDIIPVQAPASLTDTTQALQAQEPAQQSPVAITALQPAAQPAPAAKQPAQAAKPSKKEAPAQSQTEKPKFTPSLPRPASKTAAFDASALNASNKDTQQPAPTEQTSAPVQPELHIEPAVQQAASVVPEVITPAPQAIPHGKEEAETTEAVTEEPGEPEPPKVNIPKALKLSSALQSMLDKQVVFFKTKRDVLFDALDAEAKLKQPLSEILRELKSSNELLINPINPNILTAFHVHNGEKVKCIALSLQHARMFSEFPEGKFGTGSATQSNSEKSVAPDTNKKSAPTEAPTSKADASGKKAKPSKKDVGTSTPAKQTEQQSSVKDASTKPAETKSSIKEKSSAKPSQDVSASPQVEAPSLPAKKKKASAPGVTADSLKAFISKDTAFRHNGNVLLDIDAFAQAHSITPDAAFEQLKTLEALHVCPLEPIPEVTKQNRNKKQVSVVKLAEVYAQLLPTRKPVSTSKEGEQPQPEKADKQEPIAPADDHTISLQNLAKTAGEKSLIHFLVSLNADGLISYLPDGKICINLSAAPFKAYKPYSKARITNQLTTRSTGINTDKGIHISQSDFCNIMLEDIA